MTVFVVGPSCSAFGCWRPRWDPETGLCARHWYGRRAVNRAAEIEIVHDSQSDEFEYELREWMEG